MQLILMFFTLGDFTLEAVTLIKQGRQERCPTNENPGEHVNYSDNCN